MEKKILRDAKGRVLPGSASLPGAGRPKRKRDILDKLMKQFYGPNCEELLLDVVAIAQYDADIDFKNQPPERKRYFKPKFSNIQITDARKFLFEHFYGKPIAENKTEITTPEDREIRITFVKPKDKTNGNNDN